jgi:TonB family protein
MRQKLFGQQKCFNIGLMGVVMGYSAPQQAPFSLLPKARSPWREFVFSSGAQACAVAFLLWLRLLHPAIITTPEHTFRSIELVSTPVPVNHQPQPLRALPEPVYAAKADPSAIALRPPRSHTEVARIEDAPAPTVKIAAHNLETVPVNSPPIKPRIVAMNTFSSGSSAAPTIARAAEQVQTGGFGDPNGVPAKANTGKAVNIAAVGSFDLPSGVGYGNGTGGSRGERGVVSSTGFGSGTATGDPSHSVPRQTVQASGFGDADVPAPPTTRNRPEVSSVTVLPAEIISKPTPIYTAEARNLKIQGEVLLEVVLKASGNLHVLRVVRGLGHGLDDNAVKAAEQIRFKPAIRDGQPTDSTVLLHIVFQLA